MPKFSFILPVYNSEKFVGRTIESILGQTVQDFEVIVIDDGSSDGSRVLIERYCTLDNRIRLISRENRGLVATLNQGLGLARGEYISRIDSDDECLPNRLEVQGGELDGDPLLAVVGSNIIVCDGEMNDLFVNCYPGTDSAIREKLPEGCPFAHPAVTFRRKVVIELGGYDPRFRHCEDYELWVRMAKLPVRFKNIQDPLIRYRQHGGNVSKIHRVEQEFATMVVKALASGAIGYAEIESQGIRDIKELRFSKLPTECRACLSVLRLSWTERWSDWFMAVGVVALSLVSGRGRAVVKGALATLLSGGRGDGMRDCVFKLMARIVR